MCLEPQAAWHFLGYLSEGTQSGSATSRHGYLGHARSPNIKIRYGGNFLKISDLRQRRVWHTDFFNRQKTSFPPKKGHFLFIFRCLPLFLFSLFGASPLSSLSLSLSLSCSFLSSFLPVFHFLFLVLAFSFCCVCFFVSRCSFVFVVLFVVLCCFES